MSSEQPSAKVVVNLEADAALDRMVEKVNTGFRGGRITKTDLTSWVIRRFEGNTFESSIEDLRRDHFDQLQFLESVLRDARAARRRGAEMPPELSLLAQSPLQPTSAKRRGRPRKAEAT